jgi:hypothetical protein
VFHLFGDTEIWLYGSSDVDKLTKLLLHNPFILTLSEVGRAKDEVIPKSVQQFWASISCCLFFWHICTCSSFHITIATWRFQKTFTGKPKVLMRDKVTFSCLSLIWGHSPFWSYGHIILIKKNHIHFAEVTWTFTHQFLLPAHYISLIFCPQISCDAKDKMLHILALLKFELIQKKVLIFVNSIDMAFRLRLFLEKVNQTTAFVSLP